MVKHCVEERKANLTLVNHSGLSPLGLAINEGYIEIATYLREAIRRRELEQPNAAEDLRLRNGTAG
jgi:hypothetical protein